MIPFWERPLRELDRAEWEALCDGCGKCCLHKIEDEDTDRIYPTNVACKLLDPHSAVGVSVAGPLVGGDTPVVTLSTAHPAKFPAAVKAATGIEPALPSWLADLHEREERFTVLDNDQGEVERFISARTRVLEEVK